MGKSEILAFGAGLLRTGRRGSHRAAADDHFPDTWTRVIEEAHQYDGKTAFSSWLFTIARNLVTLSRENSVVGLRSCQSQPLRRRPKAGDF